MRLFSHRKGIQAEKLLQRESMDSDLRNRLWTMLKETVWDRWSEPSYGEYDNDARAVEELLKWLWFDYFKKPSDTRPKFHDPYARKSGYEVLREYFFSAPWWQVYDLIEFIVKSIVDDRWRDSVKRAVNAVLQLEAAAYRIVGREVVEISDSTEIEAIESALTSSVASSRRHFERSLEFLGDRGNPDYRNSIKESISAVESACKLIADDEKATLTSCLKRIKSKGYLHPALESALDKLYGYTSDQGGIRHALTDESIQPSFADAKFMLSACAAFVNYLLTRAAELGIAVKQDENRKTSQR